MRLMTGCMVAMALSITAPSAMALEVPAACGDKLASDGYCLNAILPSGSRGPVGVEAVFVVSKDDFPTVADLMNHYLDFDQWSGWVSDLGDPDLAIGRSVRMPDGQVTNPDGSTAPVYKYYWESVAVAPPIVGGRASSRAVTWVTPIAVSANEVTLKTQLQKTGPFVLPPGAAAMSKPEGLKVQDGTVTFAECHDLEACFEDELIVVYRGESQSYVDLLPNLQAKYMLRGQELLYTALFWP